MGMGMGMGNFTQGLPLAFPNGKLIWHILHEVLHAPDTNNCLLLISHFDVGGGDIHFKTREAILQKEQADCWNWKGY